MRLLSLTAAVLVTAVTTSRAAELPFLEASASAGACGGGEGCANPMDIQISPATNASVAYAHDASTLADGSYADAQTTATLGALHIYSDAYRATGSDAQSHNDARAYEYVPASQVQNGMLSNYFVITGSHADVEGKFGNVSQAYIYWDDYDVRTGALLDSGNWESTDAKPTKTINDSYAVPVGDDVETEVEFDGFTYSSFGVLDYIDYKDTLKIYMTTAGGAGVIGVSGHDYALPSSAPEPATWAMMLTGFGLAGGMMRRRSERETAPEVRHSRASVPAAH